MHQTSLIQGERENGCCLRYDFSLSAGVEKLGGALMSVDVAVALCSEGKGGGGEGGGVLRFGAFRAGSGHVLMCATG